MGRHRDKHGYLNKDDRQTGGTSLCPRPGCGLKAEDMDLHDTLFHPTNRPTVAAVTEKRKPLPKAAATDQRLGTYPDTGETGETYDLEDRR
jgi:hypothetical protein